MKHFTQKTLMEHEAEYVRLKFQYELPPMPKWVRVVVYYPFLGLYARVRFEVRGDPSLYVSTYLDVNDTAGIMEGPYFEAYPIKNNAERWYYTDQQEMYPVILKELRKIRKKLKAEEK